MKFLNRLSRRTKIFSLAAIVLVIVVGSYLRFNDSTAITPEYQTVEAKIDTLIVAVSASGQVASVNNVSVASQASGVVSEVYVKNGETVKSGAALAKLELDEHSKLAYNQALASYQSAANSLASAQNSLNSLQSSLFAANQQFINDAVARDLSADDPTYIQQNATWLAAENNYKNQQNVIKVATLSLTSAAMLLRQSSPTIYAPIGGIVNGLSLLEGTVVSGSGEGVKIANITTSAKPTVSISLTEVDIIKVKLGDKATITLDAYSDKTYTGKVVSVDTVGTTNSGVTSYPVVIVFDNEAVEILPNMAASASIIVDTKADILLVPSTAVKTANDQTSVQILRNGEIESVTVEVGISSDTQAEIVSGISEGDEVVVGVVNAGVNSSSSSTTSPFGSSGTGRGFSTGGIGGSGGVFIQGAPVGR